MQAELNDWAAVLTPAVAGLAGAALGSWMTGRVAAQRLRHETEQHVLGQAVSLMQGARALTSDFHTCEMAMLLAELTKADFGEASGLSCPAWSKYQPVLMSYLSTDELGQIDFAMHVIRDERYFVKVVLPPPLKGTGLAPGTATIENVTGKVLAPYRELEGALAAVQRVHTYMHRRRGRWARVRSWGRGRWTALRSWATRGRALPPAENADAGATPDS